MAVAKCKGTLLKITISSVLTTVAQCISLQPPGWAPKGFETMTLDQAGVGEGRDLSGYVAGKDFDAEIFWDPGLASHAALLALSTTPAKNAMEIVFVNDDASLIDWTNAELECTPAVAMADGRKMKVQGKIDGVPALTV